VSGLVRTLTPARAAFPGAHESTRTLARISWSAPHAWPVWTAAFGQPSFVSDWARTPFASRQVPPPASVQSLAAAKSSTAAGAGRAG
jgi:hypothetical protein